jgi:PAS domain S-box-containing protein
MNAIKSLGKLLKTNKIRNQLISGIAVVHVLLMSIFVFDMVERQRHFLLNQNQTQTLSVANELAVNASGYIMANDLDGLERLIQSHANFPSLKYSMIISPQRIVLAHTNAQFVGKVPVDSISRTMTIKPAPQVLFENDEILDIVVPIKFNHNIIGFARIGFSKEYINESLAAVMRDGMWYIMIALVIGTVIAIIMGRRLSNGLYKLINTADRIRLGDRDRRVDQLESFELQKLGASFNQMIDEISANENLLTNVLENLPVGVWIMDKDGKIKSVNAAGKELWGEIKYVGINEFGVYKAWFIDSGKLVEPEEWPVAIAVKENRAVLDQEMEIETFDKTRKIILTSAIPLKDLHGKIKGVIAINVDITQSKRTEIELKKTNRNIVERMKELDCLYHISELSHNQKKPIEEILNEGVGVIKLAYQYPEITCVRITYQGQQYQSPAAFEETIWRQAAGIKVAATVVGEIEVFYTKQMPDEDEGPFMKEERLMINSFADILGGALERKKTEIAVREAEFKFRSLVEKSLVGVYIIQDSKFVYANPQILTDSGFSETEFFNKTIFDMVLPEDWTIVKSNMEKRELNKADTVQYEVRSETKDGNIIWLEIFGTITLYNGAPAMIGTMVNITERKAIYDDLKRSEANLKSMFDTTDVAYLLLDTKYDVVAFNQHMTEVHEHATGTPLQAGDNYFAAVKPEKQKVILALYERVIQTNKAEDFEISYLKNGIPQHYTANVKPIRDGKKPIGICISSIDITDRKNALEQLENLNQNLQQQAVELADSNADLAQSKKRYSELFNFSPLPTWVATVDTLQFLDVNNAAVLHYGYSREEFLSMTLKDIRPPDELQNMHDAVNEHLKDTDSIFRAVMVHQKKNGELMNVEIQVATVFYSGIKANLAIGTDITERIKYINAIETQNKRLLDISWIQSHVARAPLARLMGLIPLLKNVKENKEEREIILDHILTSANELDEIIKSISNKSKIEDLRALNPDPNTEDD